MTWEGLLSLNKIEGKTSHDVVRDLRKLLKYRKIGHTGTLDPLASGLLLICLGRAVKVSGFLQDLGKEYIAQIRLGITTDTYDSEGKILKVKEDLDLEPDRVAEITKSFQGEIRQIPPIYSALRYKGKRLYHYARQGEKVERIARKVEIKRVDQIDVDLPFVKFRVVCSKGTYIRSLAFDIGEKLGCGAHLHSLCRTKIGNFKVEDSLTFEQVEDLFEAGKLNQHLYSIERALDYLPAIEIDNFFAEKVKVGVDIRAKDVKPPYDQFRRDDLVAIKDESQRILAITKALISSQEIGKAEGHQKIFEYKRVLI